MNTPHQAHSFIRNTQALAQIPDTITGFEIEFDSSCYSDNLFYLSQIDCPNDVRNASTKRKAEYFAGRLAVKRCFEACGLPATQISSGQHREPIWPEGITGSITHTDSHAIALVARTTDYHSLGVDIENWLDAATAREVSPLVLTPEESAHCAQLSLSTEEYTTLAFSAKESLFKAVFPVAQKYLDFSDARILSVNEQSQTLDIYLNACSTPDMDERLYQLNYIKNLHGVYTALYINR